MRVRIVKDCVPPSDKATDFRNIDRSDRIGTIAAGITAAGALAWFGIAAHGEAAQNDEAAAAARATLLTVSQQETDYHGALEPACGRLVLALRSDLQQRPDDAVKMITESNLCGKEALTIAKTSSTLAGATLHAEKVLAEKESAAVNYPTYLILGGMAAFVAGKVADEVFAFGSWCIMDTASSRRRNAHADISASSQPRPTWTTPQDRL